MARRRDYAAEYQARQRKAREEGYRSYGAKRYAKERERERELRPPTVPVGGAGPSYEQRAYDNLLGMAGEKLTDRQRERIASNVASMSRSELRTAATATSAEIQQLAKRPPSEWTEEEREEGRNKFWYH